MSRPDDLYVLHGPLCRITPADLLPYIDTVRTASGWVAAGFQIIEDSLGNTEGFDRDGLCFRLLPLAFPGDAEREAAASGKKLFYGAGQAAQWVLLGYTLHDFVGVVPPDVTAYCRAVEHHEAGRADEAERAAREAVALKPDDVTYFHLLSMIRLAQGEAAAVWDALLFYENDMDSAVHSGETEKWLRLLAGGGDYAGCLELIDAVISALDDLIVGRRTNRRFGSQSIESYRYKKSQFLRSLRKSVFPGSSGLDKLAGTPSILFELASRVIDLDDAVDERFLERLGDGCAAWGRREDARRLYSAVHEAAARSSNHRLLARLAKKVGAL